MESRDAQSGFTLIEALVAMAVLALGAVSLLIATEGQSTRIGAVTERTTARWVADYALTAARIGVSIPENIEMLGRSFPVTVAETETGDPDLLSLDVTVSSPAAQVGDSVANVLYRLTGYRLSGSKLREGE